MPEMSAELGMDVTVLGQLFALRGVGFLFGTILVTTIVEQKIVSMEKHKLIVVIVVLTSITTRLVPAVMDLHRMLAFQLIKFLFTVQGVGFGVLETAAFVGLQEMWGQRVQPWTQVMNLVISTGAILGPMCVSTSGFAAAFRFSAALGLSSFFGLALEQLYVWHFRTFLQLLAKHVDIAQLLPPVEAPQTTEEREFCSLETAEPASPTSPAVVAESYPVPARVCVLLASFTFIHIGLTFSFGGWISTYTLLLDPRLGFSEGAQMVSLYCASRALANVYAIPASVMCSTTSLLKFQLALLATGAATMFLPLDPVWLNSVSTVLVGMAVSCIYPLAMTVANDYQMTMDARSVFYVVLGGSVGESVMPVLVGALVGSFGVAAFPLTVALSAAAMVITYACVQWSLLQQHQFVAENRHGCKLS